MYLYMAVKVTFSWLISAHCWFVYWKWVPSGRVSVSAVPEIASTHLPCFTACSLLLLF